MNEIYPVIIVLDRYGGVYSEAKYTAWNDYQCPEDVQGGDIECSEFWRSFKQGEINGPFDWIYCGKGNTPNEALLDLQKNIKP